MSTLIAVHRPGGRTQRCDARCYDAEQDTECECICDGTNHGAGLAAAIENTRRLSEEWIAAARATDPDIRRVELDLVAATIPLF